MHDIARSAGVSQAAVSYAYNQPHKLSSSRREHILKVATDLGYAGPNPAGRNLRTGEIGAIGLLLTDSLHYAFDDPATALLLKGISEVGELSEVALTLLPCPLESTSISEGSGVLLRGAVDGFLAYAMPEDHPGMQTALSRKLPTVVIDGPDFGRPKVGIADRAAARAAAEHVLGLGHRRIGVLVDRLVPDGAGGIVTSARRRAARDKVMKERLTGYASAFRAAGIDWAGAVVVEAGGFDHGSARAASELLLNSGEVTAVLAGSDVLALATVDAAERRGLNVPENLSVVGFDDIPAAEAAGLTTMHQPLVDKGRRAAQLLLDVIDSRPSRSIKLGTELVVRRTTGRAPHDRRRR